MSNSRPVRPSLRSRLHREEGTTLIELLATMAIFGIVLGALTTMFVSAGRAESRQSSHLAAQQAARLALVKLRRELHCATAISASAGAVTSVTATLPAVCFGTTGASTSVTFNMVMVSTGRWRLQRVQSTTTTVLADYVTYSTPFTYTSPSSSSLGSLRVDLRVNFDPGSGRLDWILVDDIVLRNTMRA